jgi:hypothetical protein
MVKPYSMETLFGSMRLECVDSLKTVALDDVAWTKREQKAAKADGAAVPEYLWLEHLMDDGPTPWLMASRKTLPKPMTTARKYLIRRWKVRLRHAFWNWIESKYHLRVKGNREETIE